MTLFSLSLVAYKQDLREMGMQQRNEYLIKLAKEVAHQFGPEWCDRDKLIAQVDDTLAVFKVYGEERPEVKKNEGRLYHRVTLNYDNATRQKIGWKYAAIVLTWADDGEPFCRRFRKQLWHEFLRHQLSGVAENGRSKRGSVKIRGNGPRHTSISMAC